MNEATKRLRMIIDVTMTAALPLLMAYSLIGEGIHEILGLCMLALFIVHHIINRRWWTSLAKGKYSAARVLNTAVNLCLAIFMLAQPISGVLMSKYVLRDVAISGTAGIMRTVHLPLAYWGFMLMSFHLGLHFSIIIAKFGARIGAGARKALAVIFILLSAYGVYAFIKRGIAGYLFLRMGFAFYDYSESRIFFILDYISVMILTATTEFWINVFLKRKRGYETMENQTLGTQLPEGVPSGLSAFPVGQPNDAYAQYFTGQSYLAPLTTEQIATFNVTFEPGCRNNWHIHHASSGGGQLLICISGRGWYQEWGKEARELHPGDIVNIPANVKHWHGAAADSWFQHIAQEVAGEDASTEWCEPVNDDEYGRLA